MKLRNILLTGITILAVALPSCKKDDDDDDEKDYLSGTLELNAIPSYLNLGEEISLTPSGITTSDVGYYYYNTWNDVKDTTKTPTGTGDGSYTINVPDSIGAYTITCIAYADGYYTSSAKANFTVVNPEPETTLTDSEWANGCKYSVIDSRDNKLYYVEEVNGKEWFKNNVGCSTTGTSYESSPVMDRIFGRLYNWNEAQTACPEGWRLPTDQEFLDLAASVMKENTFKVHEDFAGVAGAFMVNAKFIGERMWEYWPQDVTITNTTGFCALPVGYLIDLEDSQRFVGLNEYSAFWTADEDGEDAYLRYLHLKESTFHVGLVDKVSFKASVRCVKAD